MTGEYVRPVSALYSAIAWRASAGTALAKWVRWSAAPAWKSGWFCTGPVSPGELTSTSAGTSCRVPFSKALSHCRRHWACNSAGTNCSVASTRSPALSCSTCSAMSSMCACSAARSAGRKSSRWRARYALSWNTRPLAPNRTSWATVGLWIRPAGSPRYSRSNSGSGSCASLSMWLVENPSMALATGISDSADVR